jgi:hypothetical protein
MKAMAARDDDLMLSPELRERLVEAIAARLAPAIAQLPGPRGRLTALPAAIGEFFDLYGKRPVRDNAGGSGFNDSLCLYLLGRLLGPLRIVESGTWKGHSAWLFRRACPKAAIDSFDPDPDQLVHREADIGYHACDWTERVAPVDDPARALIFFDDHVSHARRIGEAHARGFRHVILDDNLSAATLYATGMPPVPSLRMIIDDDIEDGTTLTWLRNGKRREWTCRRSVLEEVQALIDRVIEMPDLSPLTRYTPQSGLTLAVLRS